MKTYIFRIKSFIFYFRSKVFYLLEYFIDRAVYYKWNNEPFGNYIHGSRNDYQNAYKKLKNKSTSNLDKYLTKFYLQIDYKWFLKLAIHTQVVIKKSDISIEHGVLLYAHLCKYLKSKNSLKDNISILETGTARGYSSVCMAKALSDNSFMGKIFTLDIIPHNKKFYWNIIDDLDAKKSRTQLLSPWKNIVSKYIFFIQGNSKLQLEKINSDRFHFAFLDGAHTFNDLCYEFNYVNKSQIKGDLIFLDDYNKVLFPELVRAIDFCCKKLRYKKTIIDIGYDRKYVIAQKL